MAGRKKVFPCGHSGKGQYCHTCAAKEKELEEKRLAKESWASTFANDSVDLRSFPRDVVLKARDVLHRLEEGAHWGDLKGKRLNHDRNKLSIPVGRDYRLLCDFVEGTRIVPRYLQSHEDYNVKKPG